MVKCGTRKQKTFNLGDVCDGVSIQEIDENNRDEKIKRHVD